MMRKALRNLSIGERIFYNGRVATVVAGILGRGVQVYSDGYAHIPVRWNDNGPQYVSIVAPANDVVDVLRLVNVRHIDDVEPRTFFAAPDDVQVTMRDRFETSGTTVIDTARAGFLLVDIENWWDGPTSVRVVGDGDYEYTNIRGNVETFSRVNPADDERDGAQL